MANNYFGFTPGGTQYSAQPAAAYPAAQTAYVAAQPAQTAYAAAAAPRAAQTYETFQPAPSTGTYAYAARTQVNVVLKPAAYEQKTYYQPTAQPAYTVAAAAATDTAYHAAAKPAYGGGTFQSAATRPATSQKTPGTSQVTSTGTYVYPTTTATTQAPTFSTTTSGSTYSGYDAALYSAATSYYQQQQVAKTGATWKYNKGVAGTKTKMKPTPKQMQLHYCDVCKISCAGPQTYREHLEGQKHKKKEAAAKEGAASNSGRGQNQLRCELCDVACTGTDAYQAHIRGAKHQKVLKLHTMLGKPIPSTEPTIVNAGSSTTTATSKTTTGTTTSATKPPTKTIPTATATAKKVVTPKITFVGGTQLKSMTSGKSEEVKVEVTKTDVPTTPDSDKEESKKLLPGEKDVQPVGHEYIEEVKNEMGKTVSFNCKLCECKFNDPNAKEMHMKGRRHRLQYKKKVDPRLQVEIKPSIRARKIQEEKLRRQAAKEEFWRNRAADQEERWREEMMRYEEEQMYWTGGNPYDQGWQSRGGPMGGPRFGGPQGPMGMPARRPDTADDRHVVAKHASIYPSDAELQAVQSIVSSCEKGLKQVSDFIAESDAPKPLPTETKEAPVKKEPEEEKEGETKEEEKTEPTPQRVMKGVMRVGVLAKGLLLHGDLNVQLVVLCSEKPTRTLLERVYDNLPKQLASISEEKYETKLSVEEAAVVVTSEKEPKTTCTITLTSPIMREENLTEGESVNVKDPPDVLDRQKCLDALAALRHAKWFQARANSLQSCVVVIRILRDLCQRVPTWAPISQWAMELLVEKCVSSGPANMNPGDAMRRVFECIASGILLPGGPGLYDPCEKDPVDAAASLAPQQREDITASAQHALRLIAFRQIHKVLGMDALPPPQRFRGEKFGQRRLPRKRRRTNSGGEAEAGEGEGKKDKKEGEGEIGESSSDTQQS